MLPSETEDFDGLRVTTTMLQPIPGAKLQAKLARALAPAVSSMKGLDVKSFDKMLAMDLASLGPVLAALFAELSDSMVETLIRDSLINTFVVGPDDKGVSRRTDLTNLEAVNQAFEGKLAAMYKVIAFAWKVNFADFFGGAFAKLRANMAPAAEAPVAMVKE